MEVRLDVARCAGHALCNAVDPDYFPLDDAGYSTLQDRDVEATDDATVRQAVAACPEGALIIVTGGSPG